MLKSAASETSIKVGLCGFTMGMAAYPKRFPVVEVQQTFYQPPPVTTLARWRKAMPRDFEFTIKAWQLITHTPNGSTYRRLKRPLSESERAGAGAFNASPIVDEAWATTLSCARTLSATAILFQCPASFRNTDANIKNMRAFFARMERPRNMRLLWEPRGPWPLLTVRDLCADLKLTHVVDPFLTTTVTDGLTYFRLHGTTGARHVYTDDELARLVRMIPAQGQTYVMFNNMPRIDDSRRYESLLRANASATLVAPCIER